MDWSVTNKMSIDSWVLKPFDGSIKQEQNLEQNAPRNVTNRP